PALKRMAEKIGVESTVRVAQVMGNFHVDFTREWKGGIVQIVLDRYFDGTNARRIAAFLGVSYWMVEKMLDKRTPVRKGVQWQGGDGTFDLPVMVPEDFPTQDLQELATLI